MSSMPHPAAPAQDDVTADRVILGVDTHKDVHVAAVVNALGVLLASRSFPTSGSGYEQLLSWARSFGSLNRAGVECTGSYGAALTRHLRANDIDVIEVNQPDKATRRRRGKNDVIDAEAAAQPVLSGRARATAKTSDGPVEMLRMFKLAKSSAIKSRTQAVNQLKAVLVCADPMLRDTMAGISTPILIKRCAQLESLTPSDTTSAAAYTLRLLAHRILELTAEVEDLKQRIADAVAAHTPALLELPGAGPDSAAALLIAAGDNPERLMSEGHSAASVLSKPPRAKHTVYDSTAEAIARPTLRSIGSLCRACAGTHGPATTLPGASPKAKHAARSSAASVNGRLDLALARSW